MASEVSSGQLASVFGEDGVLRFADGDLPSGVTHPESRRFLVDVGIPKDLGSGVLSLDEFSYNGRLESLQEVYPGHRDSGNWTWDLPDGADHWYVLGGFVGGEVVLDGTTGRVFFVQDGGGPPEPLHSGVDALAYFMYAIERDKPLYSHEHARAVEDDETSLDDELDVYEKAARKLVVELREIDPTPFTEEDAGPWTQVFEDIAGGQWG